MAKNKKTEDSASMIPTIINRFQNQEGLRALYLELTNFKNIKKMVVEIGGRSMLVMGKNNVGKSSLIQAMMGTFNSKLLPDEPITEGEESAKILFRVGGSIQGQYTEYTASIHFSEKNKSGSLYLKDMNGQDVKSPATILKNYLSASSFDIMEWTKKEKSKKLELLKNLTGRGKEIDLINLEIKNLKSQQKAKNDRADELEATLKNHGMSQEEIERYSTPIPMEPLQAEFNTIVENQAVWDDVANKTNQVHNAIQSLQQGNNNIVAEMDRIDAEIKRLLDRKQECQNTLNESEAKLQELKQKALRGEEWKRTTPRPTTNEIIEKMNTASAHNERYNQIGLLASQKQEEIKLKGEVEQIKAKVVNEEKKRNDIISSSQLPVPGLSFDDENIYLNGLPFSEDQINTATQFDVGAEIAMALNPGLRIIYLHDASLFDQEHLKAIIHKIESRGYQVIAELVAENGELTTIFTETEFQ